MENGHKNVSKWDNSLALCKFNAFASAVKLRLPVSPRTILKNFTKCNDLSSIVDSRNFSSVEKNSSDIFEWLRQEVRESCALLHMADGYLVDADGETINFKNDVYLFSSDDTLKTAERRLSYALETMHLFVECEKFCELSRKFFKDALILAKSFDESGTVSRLQSKLGLDADAKSTASLKKFRENDDLYVLQHGLNGYVDALDRILCKIGGREWDMQVLEVLEQKATMIVEFNQIRYLVDVLPSVLSMVDTRIQKSLNKIFKTAFANLAFSVKKAVLNYYYQKYETWNTSEMDPDYGTELNLIINNMAVGDSKKQIGKYRTIAIRLTWHFMLSAKQCWWRLANAVVTTPALITPMIEVLRVLAPVVSLRLKENNNRLILEGWGRLVEQNALVNEEQETCWSDFVLCLCNGKPKRPIVEATEIIRSFLMPSLAARPSLTLECLRKILDDASTMIEWNADFTQSASADSTKVDATRLFSAIFSIFARASRVGHSDTASNLEVRQLSPKVLETLTKRWVLDDVILSVESYEFLKSSFDALPWVQQTYAFWLLHDCCAKEDVIEAPSCLCRVMLLPATKYSPQECPTSRDHWKLNCALMSMMEVACFSAEMASMFLEDGKYTNMRKASADLELRSRLMQSARIVLENRSLNEWKNVVRFLDEFFLKLESSDDCQTDIIVEKDYLRGMRLVAPVSLLSDVAVLMKKDAAVKEDAVKLWLQNFYVVARDCQSSVSDKLQGYLAKDTALRHLWQSCAGIVKCYKDCPQQMVWLLLGLYESYRRANVEFHREMLEDVAPHISADFASRLFGKLDQSSAVPTADAVAVNVEVKEAEK